jgi:cytochrome P450
MTDEQLRFEAMTLFAAGHETTANAMAWTWYLLAQNPKAEARLHEEVDEVLGGRLPTALDLEQLLYTRAVLAESMRLYPPAWVIGRQAKEEFRVKDSPWTIPAGGVLLMSQFVVHRDPRWWERPEEFLPERWVGTGSARNRPRYSYFPFGGGPRQCVGEAMAWLEGQLLLATIAQKWRLRLVDPGQRVRLHATITLRPRDAVVMRVEAR